MGALRETRDILAERAQRVSEISASSYFYPCRAVCPTGLWLIALQVRRSARYNHSRDHQGLGNDKAVLAVLVVSPLL